MAEYLGRIWGRRKEGLHTTPAGRNKGRKKSADKNGGKGEKLAKKIGGKNRRKKSAEKIGEKAKKQHCLIFRF